MTQSWAASNRGLLTTAGRLTPDPMDYLRPTSPSWRDVHWPKHQRRIVIRGSRINYVDVGAGRPACVLLHGHGGNWQYWLETIPALAQHRRVIALDLPGFGQSGLPPRASRSMSALAATVDDLADALNLDAIDVVGHSMGTLGGIETAAAFPDRVRKLVLVAGPTTSIVDFLSHPMRIGRRHPAIARAVLSDLLTAGLPMPSMVRRAITQRSRLRAMAFAPYFAPAEALAPDLAWQLLTGVGAPGYYPVAFKARRYDPRPAQANVHCPIMLINGADDAWVPAADIAHLLAVAPVHANLRIAPARHLLNLEWPALFNRLVCDFLNKPGPREATA